MRKELQVKLALVLVSEHQVVNNFSLQENNWMGEGKIVGFEADIDESLLLED